MYYEKWTFIVVPNIQKLEWKDPILQILYVWMCKYANEDGICFPSINKLANNCWVSRDTITRKIKDMEELGILLRERRFDNWEEKTSKYTIIIDVGVSAQLGEVSAQTDTELNPVIIITGKQEIYDLLGEEDVEKYKNQLTCLWYMIDMWYSLEKDRDIIIKEIERIKEKADVYWYRMIDWSYDWNTIRQKFDKRSIWHKAKKDKIDNYKLSVITFLSPSEYKKWTKQKK